MFRQVEFDLISCQNVVMQIMQLTCTPFVVGLEQNLFREELLKNEVIS